MKINKHFSVNLEFNSVPQFLKTKYSEIIVMSTNSRTSTRYLSFADQRAVIQQSIILSDMPADVSPLLAGTHNKHTPGPRLKQQRLYVPAGGSSKKGSQIKCPKGDRANQPLSAPGTAVSVEY